ncbi:hypothetical protein ACFV7R_23255 [Streptomyces sp. NPDC059866]|uniref:hypothetical protein n=1 Tax=Streptomyces sp. NPDC059866 TaxID=3346978 RepID=UPI003650399E
MRDSSAQTVLPTSRSLTPQASESFEVAAGYAAVGDGIGGEFGDKVLGGAAWADFLTHAAK